MIPAEQASNAPQPDLISVNQKLGSDNRLDPLSDSQFLSIEAFVDYRMQKFEELEQEENPLLANVEASELLFLMVHNLTFTPAQRLREIVDIVLLTMSRMCRYAEASTSNPVVVKQAEMLHAAYAQLFAQSMIELAKQTETQLA